MISGAEFLSLLEARYPGLTKRPAFPFLRIQIESRDFADLSDDEREHLVATGVGMSVPDFRSESDRLFIRFDLHDASEPGPTSRRGETWLGMFADEVRRFDPKPDSPKVVHFYGFKGGQGRTTLLAFLASELAQDGMKVLTLDMDAEAPSLDLVFNIAEIPPEASIVGLRAGLSLVPISTASPRGGGSVSLVGFRPSTEEFDLDATALAFEASINSPAHEVLAAAFLQSTARDYDVLLIDHRTGLGPTVPAWVRTLPGPVVVMDRLDGQSRRAIRHVSRIWTGLSTPGVLVSYAPPAVALESMREHRRGEAWPWLEALARARSERAEQPLSAEDIEDHWILWPDDNAFRRGAVPQRDEVGGLTRDSIARLRDILNLKEPTLRADLPVALHPSGASDQGLFIVTDALRELCQPSSQTRFIFGRKGTGKTRLVHELALRKVGEPLVVAEDEAIGGLPAQDPTLRDLFGRAREAGDYEGLWWTLLVIALDSPDTKRERLDAALAARPVFSHGSDARSRAKIGTRRVFLIDGLETMARDREESRSNIQALLNVCSVLETDKILRSFVSLRIFLRTDIALWGFENFEQQSFGKRLDLSWNTQTIFNFVLSRLPNLPWIRETFPDVVADVQAKENDIKQASLSEGFCLDLMLRIFPQKLGRLNLNTTTFLRTYFSDDPSGLQSYYPRVYDRFLESIDAARRPLIQGRVSQDVIMNAHDEASTDFLTQVRQELRFLAPLNTRDLDRFIGALKEKRTPFARKTLAAAIRNTLKLKLPDIDATLEAMKEIGIFEQHPTRTDQWRVGRLFKAALKMKYGAARSSPE